MLILTLQGRKSGFREGNKHVQDHTASEEQVWVCLSFVPPQSLCTSQTGQVAQGEGSFELDLDLWSDRCLFLSPGSVRVSMAAGAA